MKYFVILLILIIASQSCDVRTLPPVNEEAKVICEVNAEWNANNTRQQTTVHFFVQDSIGKHPYFLSAPVFLDQEQMEKKYNALQGVFYQQKTKRDTPSFDIRFTDLNDKPYRLSLPSPERNTTIWDNSVKLEDILHIKNRYNSNWMLIDAKSKMWTLNNLEAPNAIAKGKAIVFTVSKQDSLLQIGERLWLKYQLKSISKGQEITIR